MIDPYIQLLFIILNHDKISANPIAIADIHQDPI